MAQEWLQTKSQQYQERKEREKTLEEQILLLKKGVGVINSKKGELDIQLTGVKDIKILLTEKKQKLHPSDGKNNQDSDSLNNNGQYDELDDLFTNNHKRFRHHRYKGKG